MTISRDRSSASLERNPCPLDRGLIKLKVFFAGAKRHVRSLLKLPRLLAFAALLTLSGCDSKIYVLFVKLQLLIETPSGLAHASSVVELHMQYAGKMNMIEARGLRFSVRGETVATEISDRRYVFVPFGQSAQVYGWLRAANPEFSKMEFSKLMKGIAAQHDRREVPFSALPTFVTFVNLRQPESVIAFKADQFSNVLGEGFALREFTIQVVDGPATSPHIKSILPWLTNSSVAWLCEVKGRYDGDTVCANFYHSDFLRK